MRSPTGTAQPANCPGSRSLRAGPADGAFAVCSGLDLKPLPRLAADRYRRSMNLPRHVRETVYYWAQHHPGADAGELAVNFYTPKGGPDNVVMVVIALDTKNTSIVRMRELRGQIARIVKNGGVGPVVIDARTLDSEIIVTGRRPARRPAPASH
jgi:hypothetical protein